MPVALPIRPTRGFIYTGKESPPPDAVPCILARLTCQAGDTAPVAGLSLDAAAQT